MNSKQAQRLVTGAGFALIVAAFVIMWGAVHTSALTSLAGLILAGSAIATATRGTTLLEAANKREAQDRRTENEAWARNELFTAEQEERERAQLEAERFEAARSAAESFEEHWNAAHDLAEDTEDARDYLQRNGW